ncbi:histidinol-phosphate aminotransferase [Methanocalculus chunghsingensis]|uniref:Histidinol-phosphate aminotransferase n=1 Tax=Methanocalculus chunghsingensis TaxID=156457 RepID=A0A8J7W918_9EURY|nr:histidinol-phosphate transaminase [Methanocalculus chunghsingensis]MBR1368540.1 histidinol-phosphate aminotransferase [Methanocalculus chunghsingensis]
MRSSPRSAVRDCYLGGGYVFAAKARDIAAEYGFEEVAQLASNENPFPPSEKALAMASEALLSVNRYPDSSHDALRAMLESVHGWSPTVTGSGMDGIIETVVRTLVSPGDLVAISSPTFSFYDLAVVAQGGAIRHVPRNPDYTLDTDAFIDAAKEAKLSFICSPNNPTGTVTEPADIAAILDEIEGILFLDNAYVEFSDAEYIPLLSEYENLIIGRTMSKVHGLAGLRIGYAFVPAWYAPCYHAAATPFALNMVSAAAAVGALSDPGYAGRFIAHVRRWRAIFEERIPYPVVPGGANFVLIDTNPVSSQDAVRSLARRGVLVRSCDSFPGLGETFIRVSIGTDRECERFLEAIRSL